MRHIVVTGATGGLGRAICVLFAQSGDRISVLDRDEAACQALARELGEGHRGYGCDLAQAETLAPLIARIEREMGPVDVLVNNAAIGPTMTPTAAMDMAAIREVLAVNLTAPFVLAREVARGMAQRRKGVILNTASLAGVTPNPKRNAYAASKAALISLTRALALEWASHGIRVNALAPGYIRTPMVAELEATKRIDLAAVRRRIPMGRIGRPDEMAQGLVFLASDQARYITGAVLVVDGGWHSFNTAGEASSTVGQPPEELAPAPVPTTRRTVLVTGGGSGIGEAVCKTLAADGDRVIILDREAGAAAVAAALPGDGHRALQADITDEAGVMSAFATLDRDGVEIDVLVNNAGIADTFKPSFEQEATAFTHVVDVNLVGTMLCAREAVKRMEPRGRGVIVNLSSIVGDRPLPPRNAYSAAKQAVINFTGCMAAELAGAGLRVVAVAPGYILTPFVAHLGETGKINTSAIRKRIPLGDLGRPQDIADAIRFLISPKASYITGTTLFVDGGWSVFSGVGDASDGENNII